MKKHRLIELTPTLYHKYWLMISDMDVTTGTDGKDYIYEGALLFYIKCRIELDKTIGLIENGRYIVGNNGP